MKTLHEEMSKHLVLLGEGYIKEANLKIWDFIELCEDIDNVIKPEEITRRSFSFTVNHTEEDNRNWESVIEAD